MALVLHVRADDGEGLACMGDTDGCRELSRCRGLIVFALQGETHDLCRTALGGGCPREGHAPGRLGSARVGGYSVIDTWCALSGALMAGVSTTMRE